MRLRWILPVLLAVFAAVPVMAGTGTITVDAAKPGPAVPPTLYGIFLEDINHAVEGGMYGEMIQNRGFEEANLPQGCTLQGETLVPNRTPHFDLGTRVSEWTTHWDIKSDWPAWSLLTSGGSAAELQLVNTKPLDAATPHNLQVSITSLPAGGRAAVANIGYWGMSAKQGEKYSLTFFARSESFKGPVTASLETKDGKVLASQVFAKAPGAEWTQFNATLKASGTDPKAQFVLSFGSTGKVWLDWVSLFPVNTWKNKPNGLRKDITDMVVALKPGFVRWPGGCYVEGINVDSAPNWKRTLGPVYKRPGTYSPWGYWNSDGFGYHEWLQFCEDIKAEPLYVINCGISCYFRSGTYVPDAGVPALIQDALDAIEYANGPVTSKWGAVRAKNGHLKPFNLKYIEIGNESRGPLYGARVAQYYKAIKAKYPKMQAVLSSWIAGIDRRAIEACGKIDIVDEHAYKGINWPLENWGRYFESYKRGDWDLYIGEFAVNGGVGRGNLVAALHDSVYMMMMEKNSDLVKMGSYAPLLVHTDDWGDWAVNLIHFDSSRVYGRASYYACKLFAENRPDRNLTTDVQYEADTKKTVGGGIGVGTFSTSAEFKDIKVESNGKVLYQSDFTGGTEGWTLEGGKWQVVDGALRQQETAGSWAWLKQPEWGEVTVSLKARKFTGSEGFLISLGRDDGRNIVVNLGGWANRNFVIQLEGSVVSNWTLGSIDSDRWYDIKAQVKDRVVTYWVDGKQIEQVTLPRLDNIIAISGRDEKAGEIVLKAVNPGAEPAKVSFKLTGVKQVEPQAKLITLTSKSPEDENNYQDPKKIYPAESQIQVSPSFERTLPPYSLSIIRVKAK